MPAAASNKRVRNTRISRPFIIGSKAWNLTPENSTGPFPEGHTKGWTVYVRGLDGGPDIGTWLKKVQFKLHHTYADSSRTVEQQPFEVSETGYGEFDIELRLYFDSSSGEKAQYRFHRLRLEPFGDTDAQIQRQIRENAVVAEVCEIVEFNEPSQEFFAKMTADEQFAKTGGAGNKKRLSISARGGGARAGGKMASVMTGDREPTARLPERSTEQVPWSLEMEKKVLEMLDDAKRGLDITLGQEREKAATRQRKMAELST